MLYRFHIDHQQQQFDLRVACHPSESLRHLLTRVLAYVLHHEPGMVFSRGVCAGKEPPVSSRSAAGEIGTWIAINTPGPRDLQRACKSAARVIVYTYRNPVLLLRLAQSIGPDDKLTIYSLSGKILDLLAAAITSRTVHWRIEPADEADCGVNGLSLSRRRLYPA
ncbi:MAG: YaeQ family protein [Thermodesulfobacteriota bacterium]